jgi:hypothetical protein
VKILCVLLVLLMVSCDMPISVANEEISPYVKVTPFEGYYAQVDVYDAEAEVPEYVIIDGKWYAVVVINSSVPPEGYEKQTVLEVREGIMAINSGAYAKFENVTTVELPSSLQSLGTASLPPNVTEITLPSLPCQDLKTALADVSTVKKITITDRGFADLSALTSLEEVTVVDGVWPYFPNLPDKEEENLYFQGFFQDGVYCEAGKVGKGTATPVWAEKPREHEQPTFIGSTSFRLFIFFSTEERFRMSYEEPIEAKEATEETEAIEGTDYWKFTVGTDGGYTYKWYINNKEVFTDENHTIERGDEGQIILKWKNDDISSAFSNTVQCALYEGEDLKAVTQLTFTKN